MLKTARGNYYWPREAALLSGVAQKAILMRVSRGTLESHNVPVAKRLITEPALRALLDEQGKGHEGIKSLSVDGNGDLILMNLPALVLALRQAGLSTRQITAVCDRGEANVTEIEEPPGTDPQ